VTQPSARPSKLQSVTELAWGWCRACNRNHEFPSDDCPVTEIDEDEAA
jgi:hypothetical protein